MVGGRKVKIRTEYITAQVPPSASTKHEQFESGYVSINSDSDESSKDQRVSTTKSSKHRRPSRSKSALRSVQQHDSIQQKQVPHSNIDPINNFHRLKSARTLISIDATPFKQFTFDPKLTQIHYNKNDEQLYSRRIKTPIKHSRKVHTPTKQHKVVSDCFDNSHSDYSDDWEPDIDEIPKQTAIVSSLQSDSKTTGDSLHLLPSDPTAFEASFCRMRQTAIDNMSYRQAVNSWRAKDFHGIVKLVNDLSSGKSVFDRAWIIFYWISQNIEYDVEAYFIGNIRHQSSDDIFKNRKGVCDAFGTIFETLCNAVQIECKKISGYAKGYSFKIEQKSFTRTNHAWNAIRLNHHWYLVDLTWGEGHLDKNNRNQKQLTPFYFLTRPEQLIYSHLPEDPRWQLLESPLSMDHFIRLPHTYSTFFEYNLDIIQPRPFNMPSFNSSLGLCEVLIRSPTDVNLTGEIKGRTSDKIENDYLIQYDADRQLWQCLFAPRSSGFHTLTLFASHKKHLMKSKTNKNYFSCAIQFGLYIPANVIKINTFPLTYGLFTERRCQIFEPLGETLKSGSKVNIHCRIPGASCARLLLDGNWLSEDSIKDGIFKRQITVPHREIVMYVQFVDKQQSSTYDGLFRYLIK